MHIEFRKPDNRLFRRVLLAYLAFYLAFVPVLLLLRSVIDLHYTIPVLEVFFGPAITLTCSFLLFFAGACVHLQRDKSTDEQENSR